MLQVEAFFVSVVLTDGLPAGYFRGQIFHAKAPIKDVEGLFQRFGVPLESADRAANLSLGEPVRGMAKQPVLPPSRADRHRVRSTSLLYGQGERRLGSEGVFVIATAPV